MDHRRKLREAERARLTRQSQPPYKDIFEAIQKGDADAVKYFVEKQNVDVNSRAPGNSGTVLGFAAGAGHQNIVEYLVAKGADVNAKDKFGYNSLLWALDKNIAGLELVKYLVVSGVDVNATAGSTRYTPLHWAAAHNKLDIVQYLLENNADINAETKDGDTPYMLARANGHSQLATYLVANGKEISETTGDIFSAAASGKLNLVQRMVERERTDPFAKNENGEMPLHVAAANGKMQVVKFFLDLNNGYVNAKNNEGETPLIVACAQGHLGVVRYLLETKHANPESVDRMGYTPLLSAAKYGHVDVMRYLIETANVDANAKTKESFDVLQVAVRYDRVNAIKYLVDEKRYTLYAKSNQGETVLHIAARNGLEDVVRYLVDEKGMEISATASDGRNVLLKACESDNVNLLKYLIDEKRADIRTRDRDRNTALHIAVENDRLALVRYLVDEQRSDIYATNSAGQSAMTLAKLLSRDNIYRYFAIEKRMTERPSITFPTTTQKPTTTVQYAPAVLSYTSNDANSAQPYIYNGQAVDLATRDKLVRDFLQNVDILNTREDSFTNNGLQTISYFVNGMLVDLVTRNKIINDYRNNLDSKSQQTKFYVNGREVDRKTRNEYLTSLTAGSGLHGAATVYAGQVVDQTPVMKIGNENFSQAGTTYYHLNGQIVDQKTYENAFNKNRPVRRQATGGVTRLTYLVNGQVVDEGSYANTIRQSNLIQPVNMRYGAGFVTDRERRRRRSADGDSEPLKTIPNASTLPWLRGRNVSAGSLPFAEGQSDHSTQTSLAVDGFLTLIDIGTRRLTGTRFKQHRKHESLLSPKEIIENRIDYDAIDAIRSFKAKVNRD